MIQRLGTEKTHFEPIDSPIVAQGSANNTLRTNDTVVVILQSRTASLGPEYVCALRIYFTPNRVAVD